ncbi:MAG: glycosyltransferase family 2 protein [Nevskia sp.]|nr:glycosyltransferase family 2 protein [Nevskia sp.]
MATDPRWSGLQPRAAGRAPVDVVVPVFRGLDDTLRAIHRVLAARNRCGYRLVAIDDCSPEPGMSRALEALAADGLLLLLRNPRNLGFVASANRGLRLSADADVVLLNSDTQVFDGWLDRLRAAAHSAADVGSATPLSNAATILSYPYPLLDNAQMLELDARELDRLAAAQAQPPVEIPTAVGFCMYLRRDCLDRTGLFDHAAFGRGYGEENDWCLRAASFGWRHVAAADTFVWHRGAASFGAERRARIAEAMRTMERLHPGYRRRIHDFIARDPLAPARSALDVARVRRHADSNRLLCGGPVRLARPAPPGWGTLLLGGGRLGPARLAHAALRHLPNLPPIDLRGAGAASMQALLRLGIKRVDAGFSARLSGNGATLALAQRQLAALLAEHQGRA